MTTGMQTTENGAGRVAGLGLLVETHAATLPDGPRLVLPGGVRDDEYGHAMLANLDGTLGVEHDYMGTLARTELGICRVPGTTGVGFTAESAGAERNILTYGSSRYTLTASRLTAALRFDLPTDTSYRLCGGTVIARHASAGVLTNDGTTTSLPKWIAYPTAGGVVTHQLVADAAAHSLSALSATVPWLLVWWGAQSHWADAQVPVEYMWSVSDERGAMPMRYAFQADCPLLLVFETLPTTAAQTTAGGGLDLTWGSAAGSVVVLPLYGRQHQHAATTEGWGASWPSGVTTQATFWANRLAQYPETVTETSSVTGDTVTFTEAFTYTTVHSGGTAWAPLPPWLGIALGTAWTAPTVAGTVVDGALSTQFGPSLGVAATSYDWSLSGLSAYTAARTYGAGTVSTAVQAAIAAEVTRWTAHGPYAPWYFGDRYPQVYLAGDVWTNPALERGVLADAVACCTGSVRTDLAAYLTAEQVAHPLETTYNQALTDGTARGLWHARAGYYALDAWRVEVRQHSWSAWALLRHYQALGGTPTSGEVTALAAALALDRAECDWATGAPFAGHHDRPTSVEDANRQCAGALGVYGLATLRSDPTTAATALAAFARTLIWRVGCSRYPRWATGVGLFTYPSLIDTGDDWQVVNLGASAVAGYLHVPVWHDTADDPRLVCTLTQHEVHLDDSNGYHGVNAGFDGPVLVGYRDLVQPVALALRDALGAEALIYQDAAVTMAPDWYLAFAWSLLGAEHGLHSPQDGYSGVLAEAWLRAADGATLEGLVSHPHLTEGGDPFYLGRLVETAYAQAATAPSGPGVSNLTTNLSDYAGSQVPAWSKFEVTFDLATAATNRFFPYDAAPPVHVDAGTGVTVDLLLSPDNWATTQVMPCYYAPDYEYQVYGGQDWLYPTGVAQWHARFAPPSPGLWHYRLRATDSTGTSLSSIQSFMAVASAAHGFVRLATHDARYFEYSDGTFFPNLGMAAQHTLGHQEFLGVNPVQDSVADMTSFGTNGIHTLRFWLDGWSPWGAYSNPWRPLKNGGQAQENGLDGVSQGATGLDASYLPAPGSDVALDLWTDSGGNPGRPAVLLGWNSAYELPVKPSTWYRITLKYLLPSALTQANMGESRFGLGVMIATSWAVDPWNPAFGTPVTVPQTAATGPTWQTISGEFQTGGGQHFQNYVSVALQNCANGGAYIDRIDIEELTGPGGTVVQQISPAPWMDMHKYVKGEGAAKLDLLIGLAEAHGVTLSCVLMDHSEGPLIGLDPTTGLWTYPPALNDATFFGADDGSATPAQWYQRAWWRYAQGRWGYSSAIHSWELCNEAPRGNVNQRYLAELLAQTMHGFANPHLVTTSHDIGMLENEFWANAAFQGCDFATVHLYVPPTDQSLSVDHGTDGTPTVQLAGDWGDTVEVHRRISDLIGVNQFYGTGNLGYPKPVIRGETGWLDAELTDDASVVINGDLAGVWLRKFLGAQLVASGLHEWYFHTVHIYDNAGRDHRALFKPLYDLLAAIPLNNGHYTALSAASGNANLRLIGQKDDTNTRGHLWVDNKTQNLGQVLASSAVTSVPVNTTITVPVGAAPGTQVTVTWTDPANGTTVHTETVTVT